MKHSIFYIGIIVILALITIIVQAGPNGKCRVLISSGGGDRIFFEYGALTTLHKSMPKEETQYDVVTGISAGSLLASLISRWKVGDEDEAIQRIGDILFDVNKRDDIIKEWPGGWWEGMTQHSGIFDSSPLFQRINDWILPRPSTDRALRIGTVDLYTGKMDIYHENSENLNYGILGSCSVPGIFPTVPVTMKDGTKKLYVDGGAKTLYLADPGLQVCLDKGYKEEDIIVDALMCYTVGMDAKTIPDDSKTVDNMLRGFEISSFHNAVAKLNAMMQHFPKATFRWIVQPDGSKGPLPSVGLNFVKTEMIYMYQRGLNDTLSYYEQYQNNGNAHEMMKHFNEVTADNHINP